MSSVTKEDDEISSTPSNTMLDLSDEEYEESFPVAKQTTRTDLIPIRQWSCSPIIQERSAKSHDYCTKEMEEENCEIPRTIIELSSDLPSNLVVPKIDRKLEEETQLALPQNKKFVNNPMEELERLKLEMEQLKLLAKLFIAPVKTREIQTKETENEFSILENKCRDLGNELKTKMETIIDLKYKVSATEHTVKHRERKIEESIEKIKLLENELTDRGAQIEKLRHSEKLLAMEKTKTAKLSAKILMMEELL